MPTADIKTLPTVPAPAELTPVAKPRVEAGGSALPAEAKPPKIKPGPAQGLDYILGNERGRFAPEDLELMRKAFEVGERAHSGQERESGEPYFYHCIEVARYVMDVCPEPRTVAAALLHDVVEDTPYGLEDLKRDFPEPIPQLVDGLTKLKRVDTISKTDQKAESLRKLILAMARDIRVVIVKLCDRMHNMQTVDALPVLRQERLAKETLDIYAPLAHMLGMAKLKGELEDLSMRVMLPDEYRELAKLVAKKRAERDSIIAKTCELVRRNLVARDISAEVVGRPKHFYSIYQKMKEQERGFDEIYDLLAVRIITKTVRDCYGVIGIVHSIFKPIPGRMKDYIAVPKQNAYQSLHTSVIGLKGERLEIQIRTEKMHQVAEEGVAAHWKYKLGGDFSPRLYDQELAWLRRFSETLTELPSDEVEKALQRDVFADSVYCFTPAGAVVEMPLGSTPIDFAYHIHSKLGDSTSGAKVNGKMVPLSHVFSTGDTVEIITSKKAHPTRSWLKFAQTTKASSKIKRWLRSQGFEQNAAQGRDMILQALKGSKLKVTTANLDEEIKAIIASTAFHTVEDLYAEVGFGSYTVTRVVQRLHQVRRKNERRRPVKRVPGQGQGIVVDGLDDTVVRLAGCCNPAAGDDIVGFVTIGRGVSIHRRDCRMIQRIEEQEEQDHQGRLLSCHWADEGKRPQLRYAIRMITQDRTGILADLANLLKDNKIFIVKSSSSSRDAETALVRFVVVVESPKVVDDILAQAAKVEGVIRSTRTRVP